MNTGAMKSMLLLDVPNISNLRLGVENYSKVFLLVAFVGALTWEFVTDMKFMAVVKNLVLALIFMGCFYQFHTKAVELSFKASEELLREVSPRNIFLKKWNEVKVSKLENGNGSFIDKVLVPNINDLLGTALYLVSKVCILILKLIYTTVYYFTFIFAPVTAVLSFIPISKNAMGGTITSSLWCILLPLVLAVFLALVGNTVQMPSENGQLAVTSMDQLIWIFGITLLMLLTPSLTFTLIKGSIASTADAVGVKMTGVGAKALASIPFVYGLGQKIFGKGPKTKVNNFKKGANYNSNFNRSFSGSKSNQVNGKSEYQKSFQEKVGGNLKQVAETTLGTANLSKVTKALTNVTQNSVAKPSLAPTSNLPAQVNTKANNISSAKIPLGSSFTNKNSIVSKPAENRTSPRINTVRDRGIKINPDSKFIPRTIQAATVRATQPTKPTEVKPTIERMTAKEFKVIRPKERQREV